MKIEFKVFLNEQDFRNIRTQFGFDEERLWTHQEAVKWLDNQGCTSIYTYDYSMAKDEQIIMKTYDVAEELVTLFNLQFPEVYKPVRNYEVVSLIV
jgi:hypothetical protein